MKIKILFLLFILLRVNALNAQQYTQNVPFDSTLTSGLQMPSGGSCTQNFSSRIQLDTSLYHYVNGLQFMIIIDTVHFAGPINLSPIQAGDTIILDSAHPVFSLPSSYSGNYWFRLKLIGIPNTLGQYYPCQIEIQQCTCACSDMIIKKSDSHTSVCQVDLLNTVRDIKQPATLSIYPNPASHTVYLRNISETTIIKLVDGMGKQIMEKEIDSAFDYNTSNLPSGMYLLLLFNEGKGTSSYKLFIQNNP